MNPSVVLFIIHFEICHLPVKRTIKIKTKVIMFINADVADANERG